MRRARFGSDTQSPPTPAMRAAMAAAEVGDDQRGQDPTTHALEERVADLLGAESAVFLPSGTMANVVALRVHVGNAGGTVVLDRTAHVHRYEAGALGALCGAVPRPLDGDGGRFTVAELLPELAAGDFDEPPPRAVVAEQTTNVAGGRVWPVAQLAAVAAAASAAGVASHLDGARLLNAAVATGTSPREHAAPFDSAWICLSKGLGCPAGAVLVGGHDFVLRARRQRQMLGGALRQAGVLAAAGLHALDHHVERLAEDHARARALAERAAAVPGVGAEPADVETNIVLLQVRDAAAVGAGLDAHGVDADVLGPTTLRLVTHLGVDDADVDALLRGLRLAVGGAA